MALHRQHQRVVDDELRRGARAGVPPARDSVERLLRRPSSRRQPLRREPGRARRAHRRAEVALPGGASRTLGLRLPVRAEPGRRHRRRQAREGGGAGLEAGLHLRLRARHRQAAVADRGAAGREERRTRRVDRADAAVPDQAARVRSPGRDRGRPHRPHAGAEAGSARDPRDAWSAARSSRRRSWPARTARRRWCSSPARPAAPTGAARRSIPRAACSTCRRRRGSERWGWHRRRSARSPTCATCRSSSKCSGPQGLPLFNPPWTRLTAIDLNKGDDRVAGAARRRSARSSGARRSRPAEARRVADLGPGAGLAARDQDARSSSRSRSPSRARPIGARPASAS